MSSRDATNVTEIPPESDVQTFALLRHALIRVLRTSPEAREPVCDALELVESLQQKMEPASASRAPFDGAAMRLPRERKPLHYQLQTDLTGTFLVEQRDGHSQPFRCPRVTYDAAANLLAAAPLPLHFDELLAQTGKRLRERQPDYRLRVAVRFWLAQGLIAKVRTKYTAIDPAHFVKNANAAWDKVGQAASTLPTLPGLITH